MSATAVKVKAGELREFIHVNVTYASQTLLAKLGFAALHVMMSSLRVKLAASFRTVHAFWKQIRCVDSVFNVSTTKMSSI